MLDVHARDFGDRIPLLTPLLRMFVVQQMQPVPMRMHRRTSEPEARGAGCGVWALEFLLRTTRGDVQERHCTAWERRETWG